MLTHTRKDPSFSLGARKMPPTHPLMEPMEQAEQYRLLAVEADHRLLNNLQSIASMLSLQRQRCKSAEAADQLLMAMQRVVSLKRIHQALHSREATGEIGLKAFLQELCADYAKAFGIEAGGNFTAVVSGDEVTLSAFDAISAAIAVNELIMNAVKYGGGTLAVFIEAGNDECSLLVHNDGPPLPMGFTINGSSGLGMGIVRAFARRLSGTFTVDNEAFESGTTFRISFPRTRFECNWRMGEQSER